MLTPEEYAEKNGAVCPNCESKDMEALSGVDCDGEWGVCKIVCHDCPAEWFDQWHLFGYINLSVDGEDV